VIPAPLAPAPQPVAAAPVPEEVAAPPVADPAPPAKSAKEEKEDARRSLERGKLKDSVEAGERSVALDATDAEAWLILGSAEQELGHGKSAREAFLQCTKEAKTGPVRECSLMLR
jgi:cytochrome c-type biogenesis protein CcmH/NrfG